MRRIRWALVVALVGAAFVLPIRALPDDISGIITTTRVITSDSRLVGDVTCTVTGAPCISFGASHIELKLNGFTISGQGDATAGCSGGFTAGEQGINTNGQADVEIKGPGIIQRFRSDGILFVGTLRGKVEGVMASTNCQSGIRVNPASSRIGLLGNVSVRNGSSAAGLSCGGI